MDGKEKSGQGYGRAYEKLMGKSYRWRPSSRGWLTFAMIFTQGEEEEKDWEDWEEEEEEEEGRRVRASSAKRGALK